MLSFFPANKLAGYYRLSFQDKGFKIWDLEFENGVP